MANRVDPDQTAPIGAVCSGSLLFASILLKLVSKVRQLFAAEDFCGQHFGMHFFLGALRVNIKFQSIIFLPHKFSIHVCFGCSKEPSH